MTDELILLYMYVVKYGGTAKDYYDFVDRCIETYIEKGYALSPTSPLGQRYSSELRRYVTGESDD